MPATYEPIATTTLSSAAASITFSSIPGTYTDLVISTTILDNASSDDFFLRLNSDTASNYSLTRLYGDGTSATSGRSTSQTSIIVNATGTSTTIPHFYLINIFSYAGTTNKTVLIDGIEDENGIGYVLRKVGLYRNTAAITSASLTMVSGNFKTGTTATLYGILKA